MQPSVHFHLNSSFLMPAKCDTCQHSFEGACFRSCKYDEQLRSMNGYPKCFDFGPCGRPDVEELADLGWRGPVHLAIPGKCVSCELLRSNSRCGRYEKDLGHTCSLDFSGISDDIAECELRQSSQQDDESYVDTLGRSLADLAIDPNPGVQLQPLRVSAGWTVRYNTFCDVSAMAESVDNQTTYLTQDLLQLRHDRSEHLVDLGWTPDGELEKGEFHLHVYEKDVRGKEVFSLRTKHKNVVVAEIERICREISDGRI